MKKKLGQIKANGVHYTPPKLAQFLAEAIWEHFVPGHRTINVLDPACGDGALLAAIVQTAPKQWRQRVVLMGYETDASALDRARRLLAEIEPVNVHLQQRDFLCSNATAHNKESLFDIVIANPPYVRTQALGANKARLLARQFQLTGRVDLYHAFVKAMERVLRPKGTLGLLASNRFLFIQSGMVLRQFLRDEFALKAIYDLGDTKLFAAAVLPVIVIASKGSRDSVGPCTFDRVYEQRAPACELLPAQFRHSVLDVLRGELSGAVATSAGAFFIERGMLGSQQDNDTPWFLETPANRQWLAAVRLQQAGIFDDVAKIRVGIKTTADRVFIRDDWEQLPPEQRPEAALLRPLITSIDAARWHVPPRQFGARRVLYPYRAHCGKRGAIDLDAYPRARTYLECHRAQLTARKYLIESGRPWYEIWVPQHPDDWAQPKIAFPDIAEHPRFFLDRSGALVDGNCYWITLKPGHSPRWLLLMLAIANSSFATRYYDTLIHNKLYAGRRRFMTQYVKKFPLPRLESPAARRIIKLVQRILKETIGVEERTRLEAEIDAAVWDAFGGHIQAPM